VETVNLTLVVSTINAWNRIAISLGQHMGRGEDAKATA
jgi:alkylhydroperoxidase family enzyme